MNKKILPKPREFDPSDTQLALALTETGLLTEEQISTLGAGTDGHGYLNAVIESKLVTEEQVAKAMADEYHLPFLRLAGVAIPAELFKLVPEELAQTHHCVPVKRTGDRLMLAMYNPLDVDPVQEIEFRTGLKVQIAISTRTDVMNVIERQYGLEGTLGSYMKLVPEFEEGELKSDVLAYEIPDYPNNLTEDSKPIHRLSHLILTDAVKARASDVHIEPQVTQVKIRYRIDGVMSDHMHLPKWVQNALASRFKVMAALDIADRRRPQDGRLNLKYKGRLIGLRISTLPTHYGEKVVMRILDPETTIPSVSQLGMTKQNLLWFEKALSSPNGLILTTGPTGSGKTSTLYAALQSLLELEGNIVTVEDPIEFQVSGVTQVQVDTKADLTFARVLRSILRQDPDVIMIGEIRDPETADIAYSAAQTGHLVLSTLHTSDAVSTVLRLVELGVDRSLIAEFTLLILAQRLARRNCRHCIESYTPDPASLQSLGLSEHSFVFKHGHGCDRCRNTGFLGRVGLFEALHFDRELSDLVAGGGSPQEIRELAIRSGTKPLLVDSVEKIRQGLIMPEEAIRVFRTDDKYGDQPLVTCPHCGEWIESDLAFCTKCNAEIRTDCPKCSLSVNPALSHCPYCRAEMPPIEEDESSAITQQMPIVQSAEAVTETEHRPPPATVKADSSPAVRGPSPQTPANAPANPSIELPGSLHDVLVPDGNLRILIVDDDDITAKLLTFLLKRWRLKTIVERARNGREGLEKIKEAIPHLIILDLMMPEMSGQEFLELIRQDLTTAFVPVVVVTATEPEDTQAEAKRLGADAFLTKPLNARALQTEMESLLSRVYGI